MCHMLEMLQLRKVRLSAIKQEVFEVVAFWCNAPSFLLNPGLKLSCLRKDDVKRDQIQLVHPPRHSKDVS